MKRITSFLLAIIMLVTLVPVDSAYAMGGEKLDVVPLSDGQYMIKLPGVDYTRLRRSDPDFPDINPEDNPDEFYESEVKVDIADLVLEATEVKSVTITVTAVDANYSRDYKIGSEWFGKGYKVPLPDDKYTPKIYVKFDDSRDSRYIVEAKSKPTNVVNINIDFLGHTGVATRWFGTSERPGVKANYLGLNDTAHIFDLPKADQNMVLRSPINRSFQWRGHDNLVLLGNVPESDIRCNDKGTAESFRFEIQNGIQGKLNDSKYFYQIIGNSFHGFHATMREETKVIFDANKAKYTDGTEKKENKFASGLKVGDKNFSEFHTFEGDDRDKVIEGTIESVGIDGLKKLVVPTANDIKKESIPKKTENGKELEQEFQGWSRSANGPVIKNFDDEVIEGDTTFYAIYAPVAQGKVKVEYKDSKTNKPIDSKYQLKGQEYPAEKTGDMDKAIKDEVFDTNKAPKFLGYKIKSITTDPVPNPPATANYTKNGDYTVIYTYDKLDDIIPEKKNGQDNPDVTPDVKEHYAKVTFQVAAADDEKAKLQLDNADAKSPLVYYVNPVEGKTIAQVASVKALSKDYNLYKVDANDMWKYDPDSITGTDQVISQARDTQDNVVKTEITLTAKVADKTAAKFKDKLDPQDIKVWKDDPIDWKKGVKIKDDAENKDQLVEDLKTELAKTNAKVEDLGENGTIAEPKTARKSDAQNLPEGKKGNLKVIFDDGSTLVVNGQTLYVADQKVEEKDPKDKDYMNPDLLPKDKVKVEIKLGEGVKEAKDGGKVGNGANPVVIKTYYVKPGTGLAESDFPTTTGENAEIVKDKNYLSNITWNPNELTKTFAKGETGSFVASTVKAQCKLPDALKAEFEKAINPMFENIKKKDGVYLGKFDEANKTVTVAIMDKTQVAKELTGTGLATGLENLYKNNNLIKIKVGTQDERDLRELAKNQPSSGMTLQQLFATVFGTDVLNEVQKTGEKTGKLADFIGKSVTLKLTVQEPNCEGNAVELTYTIEGKEAVSSILKGKLSPQDIKVWKKDPIDWEMGVKKDETGLTAEQIKQIKDEFSTYKDGVKETTGKAKFEDATNTPRNSDTAQAKPFVGNIKVTFSDGSELLVENQNLYVSEEMTSKDNENAPADAIEVQFLLGNGVKAKKGTDTLEGPKLYETYKVKPNLNLDDYRLATGKNIFDNINPESMNPAKFKNIVWTPADHVATKKNNVFTATATESFIMKHEFKLYDKDNSNVEITVLPEVLTDKLPENKTVAKGTTYTPANLAPIKEVKEGDNFYDYTFVKWEPTNAKDEDKTFIGTWTREQSTSEKPMINPVKPEDKNITGKGVPGSEIEVTIPGVNDPIKTTVDQNGDWTVKVPEDKKLKTGEEIVVTQKELGKKPNSDKTKVGEEPKPEPQQPTPGYNPFWPIYFGSTKTEVKPEPKHLERHEAYIAGYPDGNVRPDGDMTRAEAIAVVARLQKLDLSDKSSNIYKDTKAGMWYNAAINAAFREGYLLEKEGEDIRPDDKITRAELALLISHIDKKNNAVAPFEDVKGHKFEAAINQAYGNERIKGYPDGTFRPDNYITRAEVATMLNKLYDRAADGEFVREHGFEIKKFNDLTDKHWAYYEIMEAVHTHDYERIDKRTERWDKIVK